MSDDATKAKPEGKDDAPAKPKLVTILVAYRHNEYERGDVLDVPNNAATKAKIKSGAWLKVD